MKKHIYYCLTLLALTLSACTKEIDLELDTAEPKLVVESVLTDNLEPYRVKLTRTTPYFSEGEHYIDNALVIVTDNAGNVDTLTYTTRGIYATLTNRQGVPGVTYNLQVTYDGNTYVASSVMPALVPLDTVSYVYNEGSTFQEEGYNCAANFQEPEGVVNFYRMNFYRNDTLQTDPFKYFVVDDGFVDGNYIVSFTPYTYQTNDTCKVELLCIAKDYYQFLTALSTQTQATGGPFDPIPSNPPSNVSNGALGFFAAATRSTKVIVLP